MNEKVRAQWQLIRSLDMQRCGGVLYNNTPLPVSGFVRAQPWGFGFEGTLWNFLHIFFTSDNDMSTDCFDFF